MMIAVPKINGLTGKINLTVQISVYQKHLLVRLNYLGIIQRQNSEILKSWRNHLLQLKVLLNRNKFQ